MINKLPKDKESPCGFSHRHFAINFRMKRAKVATKLKNERINKIAFHMPGTGKPHWNTSKTKDILHVLKMLGQRKIQNTLLYPQLLSFENDDFHSATAITVQDDQKLVEAGFEYVCGLQRNQAIQEAQRAKFANGPGGILVSRWNLNL